MGRLGIDKILKTYNLPNQTCGINKGEFILNSMEQSDILKKEFIKEVKNQADYFNEEDKEDSSYEISDIVESYWKSIKGSDSREWYKYGNWFGDYKPSKTGKDLLGIIIGLHNETIKKFLRDNDLQVDKNVIQLMQTIEKLSEVLYDLSIETVSKSEAYLSEDDVLAHFQGYLNKIYKKSIARNK